MPTAACSAAVRPADAAGDPISAVRRDMRFQLADQGRAQDFSVGQRRRSSKITFAGGSGRHLLGVHLCLRPPCPPRASLPPRAADDNLSSTQDAPSAEAGFEMIRESGDIGASVSCSPPSMETAAHHKQRWSIRRLWPRCSACAPRSTGPRSSPADWPRPRPRSPTCHPPYTLRRKSKSITVSGAAVHACPPALADRRANRWPSNPCRRAVFSSAGRR